MKDKLPSILKTVLMVIASAAVLVVFAALVANNAKHTHEFVLQEVRSEPDCEKPGESLYACMCGETEVREAPALGHSEKVIPGKPATCTQTGISDGKECTVCGKVTLSQGVVETVPHTYDDKYDATCNVCGFIREAECPHKHISVVKGTPATCTSSGLSDGSKCDDCGEIIVEQSFIAIKAHSYDDKYDAECNVCGFIRDAECAHKKQSKIPGTAAIVAFRSVGKT